MRGPSYNPWLKTGFRIFFALCSLGAATELLQRLSERTRPNAFYWDALVVAAAWFIVIVMLVKTVEWLAKRQATRKPDKYETASLDKK